LGYFRPDRLSANHTEPYQLFRGVVAGGGTVARGRRRIGSVGVVEGDGDGVVVGGRESFGEWQCRSKRGSATVSSGYRFRLTLFIAPQMIPVRLSLFEVMVN
jgi:hypothetical protein